MQGDLHRAKTKEVDRKRERHHSVSKLLSGVDDMRIQDALEIENYYRNSEEDEVVSTGYCTQRNVCPCFIFHPFAIRHQVELKAG